MLVSIDVSDLTKELYTKCGVYFYPNKCGYEKARLLWEQTFTYPYVLQPSKEALLKIATPNLEYGLEYESMCLLQIRELATIYAMLKSDGSLTEYNLLIATIENTQVSIEPHRPILRIEEVKVNEYGRLIESFELPGLMYLNDSIVIQA